MANTEVPSDIEELATQLAEAQTPAADGSGLSNRDAAVAARKQELINELGERRKLVERGYRVLLEAVQQREASGQLGSNTGDTEEEAPPPEQDLSRRLGSISTPDGDETDSSGRMIIRP